MSDGNTLPRLLGRNAARWPHRPAWRHKRLGIWQTQSWSAFAKRTNDIALGLAEAGFGEGDRLAVLGDNRPDLYAALLAAQTLGGIGVPLDPDAEAPSLAAILEHARVSVVVVDTVDQADRLRPLAEALSSPARIFCADAGGLHRDEAWERLSLDALANAGREYAKRDPGVVEASIARGAPQDLALLLYPIDATDDAVSATHPLSLSHQQLLAAAEAIAADDPVRSTDEALCYLPMASYEDAIYALALGLLGGFACNCPESSDSVLRDLRDIGPTILFLPPAACAELAQLVTGKAETVTGFKRRCFGFYQRLALRAEDLREQGQPIPAALGIGCRIGEWLAYAPVRDQLGLNRARWVHVGGSAPAEPERLLRAYGIALRPGAARAVAPGPARESRETLHA